MSLLEANCTRSALLVFVADAAVLADEDCTRLPTALAVAIASIVEDD